MSSESATDVSDLSSLPVPKITFWLIVLLGAALPAYDTFYASDLWEKDKDSTKWPLVVFWALSFIGTICLTMLGAKNLRGPAVTGILAFIFLVFLVVQGFMISKYTVQHKGDDEECTNNSHAHMIYAILGTFALLGIIGYHCMFPNSELFRVCESSSLTKSLLYVAVVGVGIAFAMLPITDTYYTKAPTIARSIVNALQMIAFVLVISVLFWGKRADSDKTKYLILALLVTFVALQMTGLLAFRSNDDPDHVKSPAHTTAAVVGTMLILLGAGFKSFYSSNGHSFLTCAHIS